MDPASNDLFITIGKFNFSFKFHRCIQGQVIMHQLGNLVTQVKIDNGPSLFFGGGGTEYLHSWNLISCYIVFMPFIHLVLKPLHCSPSFLLA